MASKVEAVQLEIVLKYSKPSVWRKVVVRSDVSFYKLHWIIQFTMGWENSHLFEFNAEKYRIGEADEEFKDFGYAQDDVIDCKKITLKEVLDTEITELDYLYDFGDSWEHQIKVERVFPLEEDKYYPYCTEAKWDCPPEDCGGIPGFQHLLEVMKNKKHPEHRALKNWMGGLYKQLPADLEAINEDLSTIDQYIDEYENGENT